MTSRGFEPQPARQVDAVGMPGGGARARAERAQTFRDEEAYMDSWPWFPVERADRSDPEVRW